MPPRKFQFRLQSVLEYKEKREEQEQRELARLLDILAAEERKLADLRAFQKKRRAELAEKSQQGTLDVEELKRYDAHQKQLTRDISAQQIRVQQAHADAELEREKLLAARKDVKTYEKLKEKHRETFMGELNLEEQKLIDEIATTKFSQDSDRFF